MSEFESRYGVDLYDGGPRSCPDGMYPWDVDYPADEVNQTFEGFRTEAEFQQDSLNLPISWIFKPEDEGGEFELVFTCPRKNGRTWSLRLAAGFDRAEVEEWLETWTRQVAAHHFGWVDQP